MSEPYTFNNFSTGERYASLNLHYLLHYPEAVQQLGPMWANTCYEFENANGELKQLFHGTRKIDIQVSIKSTYRSQHSQVIIIVLVQINIHTDWQVCNSHAVGPFGHLFSF